MSINLTSAQDSEKHQLKNWHVSFAANEYKLSRFLDHKTIGKREYVFGKKIAYNKKGKANGGKALWPYAEYKIASKVSGGKYTVTVHYRLNKDIAPEEPKITIGMDLVGSEDIEIKNKLKNTAKATFNVKLLKGKSHTVKVWFPSQGVEIHKVEVNKALF